MAREIAEGGVRFADLHPLGAGGAIAHQHRHRPGMARGAQAGPADGVEVIEVIVLRAVAAVGAGQQETINQEAMAGQPDFIFRIFIVFLALVVEVDKIRIL